MSAFPLTSAPALLARLALLILMMAGILQAQTYGTANHLVTVDVNGISVLQVVGGGVNLNISASNAVAGQDQMSVVNTATQIVWGTNWSAQKITAVSDNAAPVFTLKLRALSPTMGTPAGQITVSATAADLLLNIGRSSGSSVLEYTGIALASQGTGSDAHTITFTVQAQ
jgi:hypothetical protein